MRAQASTTRSASYWPEWQVEYVLKNTSFFYFRNQYRHNADHQFNYLQESGLLKHLERAQFRVGYEHVFTNHWSSGISSSYAMERTRNILFNEIYARHIGNLGKFRLAQRASYEHIIRWPTNPSGRVRLRADGDYNMKVGKRIAKPRVSYELFFNLAYPLPERNNKPERLVDRSRLRLELFYPFTEKFAVIPFFTEQVDFLKEEADTPGKITRTGVKRNIYSPIVGLDLRYVIFAGGLPFSRTIQTNK